MERKVAIPISQGKLSTHFGQTEGYMVFSVKDNRVIAEEFAIPPPHEYGSHPRFLKDIGCNVVIAGGMGIKAQALMREFGIDTIIGVEMLPVADLIDQYLQGKLQSGPNRCDH
jgi:predicted Fe-Mo cluster-binding NifX family protein